MIFLQIRLSGTVNDSIVDGPGLRFTVFTQGCPHHCPGCHNPHTHDPLGGHDADTREVIRDMLKNPLLSGVTLSGGEPMEQPLPCLEIARAAHENRLNVWLYTGYTWDALLEKNDPDRMALIRECDVIVEGPFILSQRSLELRYCGSKNQRLVDVKASLSAGCVVLWQPPVW